MYNQYREYGDTSTEVSLVEKQWMVCVHQSGMYVRVPLLKLMLYHQCRKYVCYLYSLGCCVTRPASVGVTSTSKAVSPKQKSMGATCTAEVVLRVQ